MTRAGRAVALALAALLAAAAWGLSRPPAGADPANAAQVAQGQALYARYCAACHGKALEGEPQWQTRKPDGTLPAPPHDASGHTWHHPDRQLFEITKHGVARFAGPGYVSKMQGYGDWMSDSEIWAVLAYIKSSWPEDVRARQKRVSEAEGR